MVTPLPSLWAGWEIRKFRSFEGREGLGFSLDLYRDGVKAASVYDEANGGCYSYHWTDAKQERDFAALAKSACPDTEFEIEDHFLSGMVDAFTNKRRFDRMSKKKVLFQVGDKIGSDVFHTLKCPYDPKAHKAYFAIMHPGLRVFVWGQGIVQEGR